MMADEKVSFTGINYFVCNYCNHLIRGEHRDGYNDGCGLKQNDAGKYARVNMGDDLSQHGIDTVNGWKGCENFDHNGVPAHPQVLEVLVQRNPKCSVITSDPNATETSWDFDNKMNRHLPEGNITSYDRIQ